MAIDKLVDSTALDAGLTSIADAIRTKGGTSAPLSFPDGMAAAVAAIPSGIQGIERKTFYPPQTGGFTITHSLGVEPALVLCRALSNIGLSGYDNVNAVYYRSTTKGRITVATLFSVSGNYNLSWLDEISNSGVKFHQFTSNFWKSDHEYEIFFLA